MADLRELNQVIVDSIQSGLITTDAQGRVLHAERLRRGRSWPALRGAARAARCQRALGSPLLGTAELQARAPAAGRSARLEVCVRARRTARRLELGVSVTPLATRGRGRRGYLRRVPGPHGDPPARATRCGRRRSWPRSGRWRPARARDPQPARLDPRLGPGADGEPALGEEQGRLLDDHLARVEAALGHAQPVPVPGAAALAAARPGRPAAGAGVGGHAAAQRQRGAPGPRRSRSRPTRGRTSAWPTPTRSPRCSGTSPATRSRRCRTAAGSTSRCGVWRRPWCSPCATRAAASARDEQRRMFEPFRGGSRLGAGLGLAIVFRIVREHGGDITVRSAPGAGDRDRGVAARLPVARVRHRACDRQPRGAKREQWRPDPDRRRRAVDARDARDHAEEGGLRRSHRRKPRRGRRARSTPGPSTSCSPTCGCPTATASRSCATSRPPRRRPRSW